MARYNIERIIITYNTYCLADNTVVAERKTL